MVSAMWSLALRRSGSRTHGKWAVACLHAGARKSRWFWSSFRSKSVRLSSVNFLVRSRTASRSSKNSSTSPVIQKHSRRQLRAVPSFASTVCRETHIHETGDDVGRLAITLELILFQMHRGQKGFLPHGECERTLWQTGAIRTRKTNILKE